MIFKTLTLLGILSVQVLSQGKQNQQAVNNIVDAIKHSGISSGINEQHLQKVLGSNSLKTGKATINVINIVPKKKVGGGGIEVGAAGSSGDKNGNDEKQQKVGSGIGQGGSNEASGGNGNKGDDKGGNGNNGNNQNTTPIKEVSTVQPVNSPIKNGQIQLNGTKSLGA